MNKKEILQITDISKKYKSKKVLNNISFSVTSGACIGIVGANGCGKSTLLKILSGALKPDKGSFLLYDENPWKKKQLFSKYIGYIPQENPLFENLTVLDNLKLWYCESDRNLADDLKNGRLHDFNLDTYQHQIVSRLSGGMKKRLSIACSIAKDPPVLILDEPGASLDIVCKRDICRYLTQYHENGGTIILTSHEEQELALCTRMLLIRDGNLAEIPVSSTCDALMNYILPSDKGDFYDET